MGRQGLWPGRRWRGLDGAGAAMRAMEDLQLDPLVVVARAHDLMLHSRVVDYAIGDWATLTYERREFFEWGGWLAVRPMEELPYFRVVMRRERDHGHWRDVQEEHAAAIEEVLAVLRERGEVSNRDFAMHARTPDRRLPRAQGQRARPPLPVADRRGDGHPARAVRTRLRADRGGRPGRGPARGRRRGGRRGPAPQADRRRRPDPADRPQRPAPAAGPGGRAGRAPRALAGRRRRDRGPGRGLARDPARGRRRRGADRGARARADPHGLGTARRPRPTRRRRSCRRSTRSAPAAGRSRCSASTTSGRSTSRPSSAASATTRCRSCGATGWSGRFDPKLDRSTGTLVINGLWLEDRALARDAAFGEALERGMARFVRFLGAERVDASAVSPSALRRRLTGSRDRPRRRVANGRLPAAQQREAGR